MTDPDKLNRLMAERVMGWTYLPQAIKGCNSQGGFEKWIPCWELARDELLRADGYDPAHDLGQAISALEKVPYGDEWDLSYDRKEGYNCSTYRGPGDSGWQPTAALAVCLCALRAVGVTEEELQ